MKSLRWSALGRNRISTIRTAMLVFLIVVFLFSILGDTGKVYALSTTDKSNHSAAGGGISKYAERDRKNSGSAEFKATAPRLISLSFDPGKNGKCTATLKWKAKKDCYYQILRRKPGGKFKVIATRKAKSDKGIYTDKKLKSNKKYVYSVRQIKSRKATGKNIGDHDPEGLALIKQPKIKVEFKNLEAVISWKKIKGAQKYVIYRRIGRKGKWKELKRVRSNVTSWTDVYNKTKTSEMEEYFVKSGSVVTPFLDPSNNPVSYTVRAWSQSKYKSKKKVSWGLYTDDGVFHLEAPTVTSLSGTAHKGTLRWGTVPMADGYIIMRKSSSGKWKEIKRVHADGGTYQSAKVTGNIAGDYFSVRAYSKTETGGHLYSGYDTSFTLKNRKYGDKKVLFIGDSISSGSPYYGSHRKSFSYTNRIQQLTGVQIFNPSIPGATLHYDENKKRHRIVNAVAGMIAEGQTTDCAYKYTKAGRNTSRIEDYDIVVISAGTNDYRDSKKSFGSRNIDWTSDEVKNSRTTNITFKVNEGTKHEKTYKRSYDYNIRSFDGAYNQVFKYIEEASLKRVLAGKPAIKVVSVGLFYSNRTLPLRKLHNRNVTRNKHGYTLKDYQHEIDALNKEWAKSPVLDIYYYDSQKCNIVNKKNCSYMSADNLHYTKFTYGLYGNSIANFLLSNILKAGNKIIDINSPEMQALITKYNLGPDEPVPDDPVPDEPVPDDPVPDDPEQIDPDNPDDNNESLDGGQDENGVVDTSPQFSGDGPTDTMNEIEAEQADKEAAEELAGEVEDPDTLEPQNGI